MSDLDLKKAANLRTALIWTFRVALFISGGSLVYLLFIFGHTDLVGHDRVLEVATLAGVSALVAGFLQWVGLPEDPNAKKKGKKKHA